MYITLIELVDRDEHPLYCVERFIEGNYVKYNSNRGAARVLCCCCRAVWTLIDFLVESHDFQPALAHPVVGDRI